MISMLIGIHILLCLSNFLPSDFCSQHPVDFLLHRLSCVLIVMESDNIGYFLHTACQKYLPCRNTLSCGFFSVYFSFLAAPKSTQASSPFGLDFLCHTRSCVCCVFIFIAEFDLWLSLHRLLIHGFIGTVPLLSLE